MADALSRRPGYGIAHITIFLSSVTNLIRAFYAKDKQCVAFIRVFGNDKFKDSYIKLSARSRAGGDT